MKRQALLVYIVFLFVLMGIAPLFKGAAVTYVSLAILLAGVVAIVFQKKIHGGKFVDMGFRLNRNALIGMSRGTLFTLAALFVFVGLPFILGLAEFSLNEESSVVTSDVPPLVTALILLIGAGAVLFFACLFGEELAFRGYVLPKLDEKYGSLRATVLCSAIFALWHLPAYFSIYTGGAAEAGWGSIAMMIIAHGISVVPICVLYLTTRELYGVSLYHAMVDVVQYFIIRNPELGDAAKDAVYNMTVLNESAMAVITWGWHIGAILFMVGLCRMAKKWTLPRASNANSGEPQHIA